MCSFISVDLNEKDWVVAYKSLKTKEKFSWVIQKVVAVAYASLSLHRSNRVSQAGRN